MNVSRNRKKKLIVSYKNLSEELLELFKEAYPEGYKDYLQKTIKPNGEPIFVVPLETDEVSYMIKFDVKIDSALVDDELDNVMYGDDDIKDDDFVPYSEALEKDEDITNHTERVLRHGSYDEMFESEGDDKKHKKAAMDMTKEELEAALLDDEEDEPSDRYIDDEGGEEEVDDFEPTEEDLMSIDAEFLSNPEIEEEKPKPAKKSATKAKSAEPAKKEAKTKTKRAPRSKE